MTFDPCIFKIHKSEFNAIGLGLRMFSLKVYSWFRSLTDLLSKQFYPLKKDKFPELNLLQIVRDSIHHAIHSISKRKHPRDD